MKSLLISALLVSFCFSSIAQRGSSKPYSVKKYPVNEVKMLQVSTSGGSITVEGTTGSESIIEMYITTNNGSNDPEEIKERLDNYILKFAHVNDKLVVEARQKSNNWNWRKSLNISFKCYVSKNINTSVATSGGSIQMKNLKGNLKFATSGGSLSIAELDGEINGSTSGGSISFDDCHNKIDLSTSGGSITGKNSSGDLRLSTSGGSFNLENLKGRIKASTSGGSIAARAVTGTLMVETSGGSINLDDISGNIKAGTSGGGIKANINGINEFVDLYTSAGNITVDMPLNKGLNLDIKGDKVSYGTLNNFSGDRTKESLYGKINGGGAKVKIYASSGSVRLN